MLQNPAQEDLPPQEELKRADSDGFEEITRQDVDSDGEPIDGAAA